MKEYTGEDLIALGMPDPAEVEELADKFRELLHGKPPYVQGAALCDVVSMWFAGHHPDLREASIEAWTDSMRRLMKINEEQLLEQHGLTEDWKKKPRS